MATDTNKIINDVLVSSQWTTAAQVRPNEHAGVNIPAIESALHHANFPAIAGSGPADASVELHEAPVVGLLTCRAKADNVKWQQAVQQVLDVTLPAKLYSSTSKQGVCLRWMAPDEWLLSCEADIAFQIEQSLREATESEGVAIVNVSGGYCVLELSGANANNVLKKSTGYDVHERNFPPGKVANTTFAKTQATIRCIEIGSYELIVRRSFADYVWLWLQNACREYGLIVS